MMKLIIDNTSMLLVENEEVIEQYDYNNNTLCGNIYYAKVKNVLNGMEASFVDIGEEKNAFLRTNKFKANSSILVQVKKDAIQEKGAIVSEKIQLTGKYVILLPVESYVSVSNKIEDEDERNRLKTLVETNVGKYGAIVRTSACGEEEKIVNEIKALKSAWSNMCENISNMQEQVPCLIYKESQIEKLIKGLLDKKISKIVTNKTEEISAILERLELNIPIEEAKTEVSFIKKEDLKRKRVWLKSGGYIIIEPTEALVSIDVNSGSYIGKEEFETTARKINLEATIEIAKQIRLRNLRGIIIVDYINMNSSKNEQEIIKTMEKEIQKDRSKVQVCGFTKLGLLEITRKQL